ncbi:hypothetical protein [Sorangium sp. So ce362]|uniref:hypothetical protein n=1 Tax=Sorangium sp. So ce362 TaxID=3133303 RepID=UPI003F621CBE
MTPASILRQRIKHCPPGRPGWREFENICIEALRFLFVPPLHEPHIQPRSYSGIDRRDAVFPNRNIGSSNTWGQLYTELAARMILFEFKNYDSEEIGKEETNQTRNYLTAPMGRLAIMCCNKIPDRAAHIKRNTIFSEERKVILFLTRDHFLEMLAIKERGDDPSDLIMDLVERFYLQHE